MKIKDTVKQILMNHLFEKYDSVTQKIIEKEVYLETGKKSRCDIKENGDVSLSVLDKGAEIFTVILTSSGISEAR